MPRDFRLFLDDIFDAIDRIRRYTAGMDFDAFKSDQKAVDAVLRNLEVIGEAARNLPEAVTRYGAASLACSILAQRHRDAEF